MKALLISPKLERSFWSFDETCLRSGRKVLCPPLGLLTVAAMLPADWEPRLVDLNARSLADADWDWADIVMIGGMIAQRDSFRDLLKEAGRKGKTVVAGGPYPTSMPDEILACGCDFLVRGEAEETLPQLLRALGEGRAGGVIEPQARPDMTASPVPRFDLLKIDDYLVMTVQTSRGCPFDCEFCDVVNLYGRRPRFKTPAQVLAELETIYRLGHRDWVFITDDNFIGNKSHARALLAELRLWNQERGEPFAFWTQATVNLGQDRELIDRMTAANFNTVFIGIESPDEEVLASARKFHNITNPLLESLNNISRNGLSIVGSFIVGLDGEKPGAGERICSFVELTAIPIVMINVLQVMPNTSLWKRLETDGRLVSQRVVSLGTFVRRMNFVPTRPESQIFKEWRAAWDYLYEPTRFLARNYRFYLAMRPTRAAMAKTRKERPPKKTASRRQMRGLVVDLLRLVRLCWRQGIRSPSRLQFWKLLFGIHSRNSSRLTNYLCACVIAEDMYRVREEVWGQAGEVVQEHPETVASGVAGRESSA
jgi:radical SAM superfamily enzyme YgiQ (UPF0313 family)